MSNNRLRNALLVDDQALNHFMFQKLIEHSFDCLFLATTASEAIEVTVREEPVLIIVNTESTSLPVIEVSYTLRTRYPDRFGQMIAIGGQLEKISGGVGNQQIFDRIFGQPIDYGALHEFATALPDDV